MAEEPILDEANGKTIDILLAEDNEADIKITLRAFDKAKIKNNVFVVRNGQEALDFVYHRGQYQDQHKYPRPDLILLDIAMPKVDGLEALKKLKSDEETYFIPVVMLTSSKNEQDVMKSFKNGAASYIQKPVTYDEFAKVVDVFNVYWHIVNKLPDGKRP